ncbi:hypothetical protein YC2023_020418 [Brassica napus]
MGDEFDLRLSEGYLLSHLTTISLSGCRLTEDPNALFREASSVEIGYIKEKVFLWEENGLLEGWKLDFYGLEEWEEWIVEEGSMPLLHTLTIDSCPKLKELPDGLRFITSLKSLAFYNMGKRWEKRLSNGGKDYYKVQHIPYVIIR